MRGLLLPPVGNNGWAGKVVGEGSSELTPPAAAARSRGCDPVCGAVLGCQLSHQHAVSFGLTHRGGSSTPFQEATTVWQACMTDEGLGPLLSFSWNGCCLALASLVHTS